MPGVHDEARFESAIEQHLLTNGYVHGESGDYEPSLAIDSNQLFAFIEATQTNEWDKLVQMHGASEARTSFSTELARNSVGEDRSMCCGGA